MTKHEVQDRFTIRPYDPNAPKTAADRRDLLAEHFKRRGNGPNPRTTSEYRAQQDALKRRISLPRELSHDEKLQADADALEGQYPRNPGKRPNYAVRRIAAVGLAGAVLGGVVDVAVTGLRSQGAVGANIVHADQNLKAQNDAENISPIRNAVIKSMSEQHASEAEIGNVLADLPVPTTTSTSTTQPPHNK